MAVAPVDRLTVVQPTVVLADPHVLSDIRDRRSIIDSLYDALVRRRQDGSFSPWLALDWKTDEVCRHWRFSLRPGVCFHDGSEMRVDDVLASIQRALSPDLPGELGTQGVLRSYFKAARVYALDPLTLAIDSPESMADLLDLLVDIAIVPEHAISGLPNVPVGSGPYRLTRAEVGRIELKAFHEHWAGPPPAKQLVWRAEPDARRRQFLVEAGEADLAVDPDRTLYAEGFPNLESQDGFLCVIFLFNLFDGPCCDSRVRQALNLAIDRDAIIADPAIAAGSAVPLSGPLAPRHWGADSSVTPYPFDPERARELLRDAGFSDGLTLDVDLPERFPDESIALARKLSQYFAAVGVSTRLHVHSDRPGYAEKVRSKQFGDLCCFDSSPPSAWRVFREKLDSRHQGPWWQGYHSPILNQILDQASAERNDEQRVKLLRHAFRIVHDDAPWLFLYAPRTLWLLGPLAGGWQPSAEGRVRITHSREDA
jgi:peptide/nickel transport system substrate-binding protein